MRLEAITRRTFFIDALEGAGKVGAGFVAAGIIGGAVGKALLYTPDKPKIKEEGSFDLYPGWIEANINAKFMDPEKQGHLPFLREAGLNNPVLKDLTKEYFNYLNEHLGRKRKMGLGDALSHAVEGAYKKLENTTPAKINPKTNLVLESLHAGFFVFAAGFMPWLSTSDLKEIGVNTGEYENASDYFLALWQNVYPKIFAKEELKENSANPETGQDRVVHFAQHLLLTFEYLYSKRFHLGIETSIPLILKVYDSVMSAGSYPTEDSRLRKEAQVFSKGLGIGWEYSNLFMLENWPVGRTVDDIRKGPWDTNVDADYKGNDLGASAGVRLFHSGVIREPFGVIIPVIKRLNDERYSHFKTEPVF